MFQLSEYSFTFWVLLTNTYDFQCPGTRDRNNGPSYKKEKPLLAPLPGILANESYALSSQKQVGPPSWDSFHFEVPKAQRNS